MQVTGAPGEAGPNLPVDPEAVVAGARAVLEANWRPEGGYTVPNGAVYPFQWLWDSCFHAVTWAALGEGDRARSELAHLFRTQSRLGFVPHVDYEHDPRHHAAFWGARASPRSPSRRCSATPSPSCTVGASPSTTSSALPPVGLRFLLDERDRVDGLIALCHPWESGGDDCPRWDHWCPGGWDPDRWYAVKGALVTSIEHARDGSPLANPAFRVASCGFNALVAFNALELAEVTGDRMLASDAMALVMVLDGQWDAGLRTWVDAGDSEASSGRVRTLDALLPVLATDRAEALDAAFADLIDPTAFGGPCGPAGVHRSRTVVRAPAPTGAGRRGPSSPT